MITESKETINFQPAILTFIRFEQSDWSILVISPLISGVIKLIKVPNT